VPQDFNLVKRAYMNTGKIKKIVFVVISLVAVAAWNNMPCCEPVDSKADRPAIQNDINGDKLSSGSSSRTITDMAGRTVVIPRNIKKALSFSPPPTTFVYMLAPEKLGAWLGGQPNQSSRFIPDAYRDKPVFKWGQQPTQYEGYIAARPDIVFLGFESGNNISKVEQTQEKLGTIPVVCVDNTRNATGYAETIRFMGNVLGVPERAEKLVNYYQGLLNEVRTKVATVPEKKRIRVYYAEGNNGLSTDPAGSVHSQLIDVCGGVNVADCRIKSGSGMTAVTMESVLMWKPDIIITTSNDFAVQIYKDATWEMIPAVQKHNVHITPSQPFNWFDRPPGVNRIVGIPWIAHIFYPDMFPENWFMVKVKEFYSIFYHYELKDEDISKLLNDK
jgi:iron complex transport system substrate-binding protein